jgi:hypothetical protein
MFKAATAPVICHLNIRIQIVGLFMKYASAAETQSVPGRKASDNTVPQLTERHFLRKVAPKIREEVCCVLKARKKENFSPNM